MKKKKKFLSWLRKTCLKIIIFLFCFTIIQVLIIKYINPPFTPNIAWEWAECVFNKQPEKCPEYNFKKLEDISPHLRKAVLAAEDQRFLSHNGFDFNEIKNAVKTLFKEKKLRGASTISMQTARSLFLLSSRSVFRKIAEIYYTVLIEMFWSKQRIFELYLNSVDWGTNVTGAEAACQKYYSKSAKNLTPSQAALMTAILPSPHLWSVKHPSEYIKTRQAQIMKDMRLMPLL
ncbi:MAG: monofunctional biosynthetic peptidoglycan transglycosylase [Deltaproteobacteria bacterium]|jgi:monofunctional biosynthetic peptidoglycan transglycosylase|nr:monofunctional biosynthetic peptidoglycan transglycosylase [Deltaproteobacteria bacterium]